MDRSPGYVYVIRETRTGLYKIGLTRRLGDRMRQLKVGSTATLIHHCHYSDPETVELYLHRLYAKHRIPQTEYFHLDEPPVLPGPRPPAPPVAAQPPVAHRSTGNGGGFGIAIYLTLLFGLPIIAAMNRRPEPVTTAPTPAPAARMQQPAPPPVVVKPEAPKPVVAGGWDGKSDPDPGPMSRGSSPEPPVPPPPAAPAVPPPPAISPAWQTVLDQLAEFEAAQKELRAVAPEPPGAFDMERACPIAARLAELANKRAFHIQDALSSRVLNPDEEIKAKAVLPVLVEAQKVTAAAVADCAQLSATPP